MPLVALAPPGGSNDLDRYELLFRFAAGGMAEVFVARQRGEGGFLRPVAIKRMLPALAEEPKFVDMFLDEARLAALVQSPYVVPTLDCGKDEEGSPYIVMELVVGVSLSQGLRGSVEKRRHVPPAVMAEVIAQTALGLYDAHHAKTPTGQPLEIVHRDVSPQNILIGVDGRARLTDFGVARALERVSRTSTGEVKGKLSYFSPEQARMEPIDQRSDIFALGVVAWEMLALERLFSRESPMAALQAVLHERIPDVRELNPDIPERLAHVVAKALERDLSLRYQTARAFAEDLRAAVDTQATPTEIGAWVEEGGGPRLATFRKKIEDAFTRAGRGRVDGELPSNERERSASASAPQPSGVESDVVGQLGALRIEAPGPSGSITVARPVLGMQETSQLRTIPVLLDPMATRGAGLPASPDAEWPAPATPSWSGGKLAIGLGVATGAAALLIAGGWALLGATPQAPQAIEPASTELPTPAAPASSGPDAEEPITPPASAPPAVEGPRRADPRRVAPARGHERSPVVAAQTSPPRTGVAEPGVAAPSAAAPALGAPRVEVPRSETPRAETPRAEAPVESVRPETPRTETPRTETPEATRARVEAPSVAARPGTASDTPAAGSATEPASGTPRLRAGTGAGRLRTTP